MKKNITITLVACLVLAIILGLIYATSLSQPKQPAKEEKKEVVGDQKESQNDMYQAILKEYQDAIDNNFYGYLESYDQQIANDKMPNINIEITNADGLNLMYAYYDIDGDGVDECIIADYSEERYGDGLRGNFDPYNIFDAYQIVDGKVSRIPGFELCGYRNLYWIGKDHTLINYGHGGANSISYHLYTIRDDKQDLQEKEGYFTATDESMNDITYYHQQGESVTQISEEEFEVGVNAYIVNDLFEWKEVKGF